MMRKLPNSLYLGHASYVCSTVCILVLLMLFSMTMCILVDLMLFLIDCISYGLLNAGLYLFFLSRPQIMFIFYFHLHEKSTYAKLFLIFKKF